MGGPASASALTYWFARSGLADAVTERAGERGQAGTCPDAFRVRGQRPRDPIPALLAEVLSAHWDGP
ncbi:hypothetical protein ACQEU5_24700 [Marinactinospora thermotolerans]|uniref:hypothetical protein n=1 Tax=Marinactinospora thermotolerans TaxID=531310 RepID=UPI003D89E203